MWESTEPVCAVCRAEEGDVHLEVCRLCFRHFCGDCVYKAPWGRFCTEVCARGFFFGDESENDQPVDDDLL